MKQLELNPIGMGMDKHADLFRRGSRIIRAIRPEFTDFYENILSKKVIKDLIADNILIQTEVSPVQIEGYELVLEHPLLPFISYPFEWTPSMFKDAALNILKLNLSLVEHGLCTQDAHPWNILFDGTSPVFVDFTSIICLPEYGVDYVVEEFNSYCMNSLLLMAKGHLKTFRSLTHEIFSFPDDDLIHELYEPKLSDYSSSQIFRDRTKEFLKHAIRHEHIEKPVSETEKIKMLIGRIEGIDVRPKASEWSNYYCGENELPVYDGNTEGLESIRTATPKHALVDHFLEVIRPETVLDIGCNRGLYSQMAASKGARVIGIDTDEQALDQMYHDSKTIGSHVLPLHVNAVAPVEAIGFKEMQFTSITERIKSDCVLCLALVHHLVFKKYQMDFNHISQLLSSFSMKYLIVEFIPKEDKHVSEWYSDEYDWYNIENFKSALYRNFSTIDLYDSFPAPRVILCCKK